MRLVLEDTVSRLALAVKQSSTEVAPGRDVSKRVASAAGPAARSGEAGALVEVIGTSYAYRNPRRGTAGPALPPYWVGVDEGLGPSAAIR